LLVKPTPRNVNLGNGRFAMFNKERDISTADVRVPYFWFAILDGRPINCLP
jgi:hypothetical protein